MSKKEEPKWKWSILPGILRKAFTPKPEPVSIFEALCAKLSDVEILSCQIEEAWDQPELQQSLVETRASCQEEVKTAAAQCTSSTQHLEALATIVVELRALRRAFSAATRRAIRSESRTQLSLLRQIRDDVRRNQN
jgi:hypothetical protein